MKIDRLNESNQLTNLYFLIRFLGLPLHYMLVQSRLFVKTYCTSVPAVRPASELSKHKRLTDVGKSFNVMRISLNQFLNQPIENLGNC